jgi:hypothetical protein
MKSAKTIVIMALTLLLSSCATLEDDNDSYGAPIVGVHHMGQNFGIRDFYVNKRWGGDVDRGGGGGGYVCCIFIPRKWHPGLTAEVRWQVVEWKTTPTGTNEKDAASVGIYIATVPVERYDRVGAVYFHFFENGKSRVAPASEAPWSDKHPVHPSDRNGGPNATSGKIILDFFSAEELKSLGKSRR